MKEKKKANLQTFQEYDYLGKSCSFQDCTGLIPFAPASHDELESYEAIYPYLPPHDKDAGIK